MIGGGGGFECWVSRFESSGNEQHRNTSATAIIAAKSVIFCGIWIHPHSSIWERNCTQDERSLNSIFYSVSVEFGCICAKHASSLRTHSSRRCFAESNGLSEQRQIVRTCTLTVLSSAGVFWTVLSKFRIMNYKLWFFIFLDCLFTIIFSNYFSITNFPPQVQNYRSDWLQCSKDRIDYENDFWIFFDLLNLDL